MSDKFTEVLSTINTNFNDYKLLLAEKYPDAYDKLQLAFSEDGKYIIQGVSIVSLLFFFYRLATGLTSNGKSSKSGKGKRKKKRTTKVKEEAPVDPITQANNEMDAVLKTLETEFEYPITEFLSLLEIKKAESDGLLQEESIEEAKATKSKSKGKKGKAKKGKAAKAAAAAAAKEEEEAAIAAAQLAQDARRTKIPYSEDMNYKFLYYNENLLRLLMQLDSVDTQGDETLRNKRKSAIKYIQSYHKKLDKYKPFMDELKANQ